MSDHVISFKIISQFSQSKCPHEHILIDEKLWNLECDDCGAILDPIAYLLGIAKKESMAEYRLDQLNRMATEAQAKTRTRCVHCGQFTPIHVSGPFI